MPNYVKGDRAAIMLKANSADEAIIKGLNKLTVPGLMRNTASAQEFRTDFDIEFTTSGKWDRVKYAGNLVLGDTKGQDQLKQYLIANEEFNDARLYINDDDFVACDLANDANACFQVVNHTPGEVGKDGLFPVNGEWTVGGRLAWFLTHITDVAVPTMAFVAKGAGNAKITDTGNGLVAAGFTAGMTLIIEGSAGNDKQVLVESVAAGEIVLTADFDLSSEASIEGCTLHGGKL